MEPGWGRADWVAALYRMILGRPAESAEVIAFHASHHLDPASTIAAFIDSDEFHQSRRRAIGLRRLAAQPAPPLPGALRVLLFGAYGNGNLGDAAQPAAIADLLRAATARPLDIRATAWLATEAYPYPAALTLGPDSILDPPVLAGFDLLLLAGGGLFAPLHFPLLHPEWLAFLADSGLPYGLLGLGASGQVLAEAQLERPWQSLLAGAAFRAGRDGISRAAMPGAAWLPDPVLVTGLRQGGGKPRPAAPPGARPLCIVKRPVHASEAAFLAAVAGLGPAVDVVATEPRQDHGQCPGLRFPADMAALRSLCAEASIVVSARYHGCIAALLEGVPCLGIGPGKSATLFAELGAPERFLPHVGELAQHLAAPPAPLPAAAFDPFRAAADMALASLGHLLDRLPRRTQDTVLN